MLSILHKLESLLESTFEGGSSGDPKGPEPLDLVRQIEREIERNKRVFINDHIYVAHKIEIHLHAPTQKRVEEYEALFNNQDFRQHLEGFIKEKGYELLDQIRIVIKCHRETIPEFGKRGCYVEFSWPRESNEPGEVTVVLDDAAPDRILAVNAPQSEVPVGASLEVLDGNATRGKVAIGRRRFRMGRGENVLDSKGENVLRTNHLVFLPPTARDAVNRTVSRQHAEIVYDGKVFRLFDTGSQNGTSVEKKGVITLVPPPGRGAEGIALDDGDVIVLGSARVRFCLGAS